MTARKKVLITFLGNIQYDTRSYNLFNSLSEEGFDVEFIGFDWLTENFSTLKDNNKTVYKLSKKFSSILFYLKFYFLLKLKLLNKKPDIIFAEDLYCLPVCVIIGRIKGAKIVYDCRELFGFLAGLKNKILIQKFWKSVEKLFISKADLILTTGELDSEFIRTNYNVKNDLVLRNLPLYKKSKSPVNYYEIPGIDENKKVLLYQGVVLHGRGLKMIFEFLQTTDDFILVIVGTGEMLEYYKQLSIQLKLNDKVFFIGKIPQDKLMDYTAGAFVGLSLIENVSLSYYYALPNKLFEYIMAEIPVITTNLPQMKKIINQYNTGFVIEENNLNQLNEVLKNLLNNKSLYNEIKNNCRCASEELCWDIEVKKLISTL